MDKPEVKEEMFETSSSDEKEEETGAKEAPVTPTKIKNTSWVYAKNEQEFDEDSSLSGKWMMFFDNVKRDSEGLTRLDKNWIPIKEAVESGRLLRACVSTGVPVRDRTPVEDDYGQTGVIMVFTKDCDDQIDVRKVAEDIRDIMGKKLRSKRIYYKTSKATRDREYSPNASRYRHLDDHDEDHDEGQFWERDRTDMAGRWLCID